MTALNNRDSALETLCKAAIEQRLGNISGLPKKLIESVLKVYRDFIGCYLNMIRQKENKPADWMPETLDIDTGLVDGMRHFFSDYQHITRDYYRLNHKIDQLKEIDKNSQPNLYQHMIDDILKSLNSGDQNGNTV